MRKENLKHRIKKISALIGFPAIGVLLAYNLIGWPFEAALLYFTGVEITGQEIYSEQHYGDGRDEPRRSYSYEYEYYINGVRYSSFKTKNGTLKEEFKDRKHPFDIPITYSSIFPFISRAGPKDFISFFDAVVRELIGSILFYSFFTFIGISVAKSYLKN